MTKTKTFALRHAIRQLDLVAHEMRVRGQEPSILMLSALEIMSAVVSEQPSIKDKAVIKDAAWLAVRVLEQSTARG